MGLVDLKHATMALLLCSMAALVSARSATGTHWVTAWAAAPDTAGPPLEGRTIRQIVRVSIGGSSVRIRLSNVFGTAPQTIGPVRIARHASGSAIRRGTDRVVTFGGKSIVTVANGAAVLSDVIDFRVAALEDLAVSLYVPSGSGPSTIHGTGIQTAFIVPGDVTATTVLPADQTDSSRFFLTDVEVAASNAARAIVIVGDSITDGVGSTQDRNARWPDALAVRLQSDPKLASIAVVNSGISGNRILNDGADPFVGPSALSRFERDALSKPGVRWILLFEGINDISAAGMLSTPKDQVTAQQIIEGMKSLIARAHVRGIKVWGATLLPLAGVEAPFHSAAGEAMRQEVNAWIRSAGAFDAVIDFDQTIRDPTHPDRMLPAFDSGDHLHPNDPGHKALAASIDLCLFTALD